MVSDCKRTSTHRAGGVHGIRLDKHSMPSNNCGSHSRLPLQRCKVKLPGLKLAGQQQGTHLQLLAGHTTVPGSLLLGRTLLVVPKPPPVPARATSTRTRCHCCYHHYCCARSRRPPVALRAMAGMQKIQVRAWNVVVLGLPGAFAHSKLLQSQKNRDTALQGCFGRMSSGRWAHIHAWLKPLPASLRGPGKKCS
jgi:hypothetical protein